VMKAEGLFSVASEKQPVARKKDLPDQR
jgi:hypothetical protein